ncbi:hypothetical protein PISMIDRAFT_687717 [Pisolithus microcarpus 441]|uniref:Uncharacterized protein n=1 Tax=Pisolithus microcarpus 441 TaxID=765257 RepID=A0A0C9XR32_9AGAM|nr:hypothetical protein PISMIDRAFT_687717 [Pisolithus microcarpus 441]
MVDVHDGVVHFGLLRRYDVVQVMSGEKDKNADPLEDPIDGFSRTRMVSESSATPLVSDSIVNTPLQKKAYSVSARAPWVLRRRVFCLQYVSRGEVLYDQTVTPYSHHASG